PTARPCATLVRSRSKPAPCCSRSRASATRPELAQRALQRVVLLQQALSELLVVLEVLSLARILVEIVHPEHPPLAHDELVGTVIEREALAVVGGLGHVDEHEPLLEGLVRR